MTTVERKKMIVGAIRKLEDNLCAIKYAYDGVKSPSEREEEMERLQRHLHSAHSVLVLINEEELAVAS